MARTVTVVSDLHLEARPLRLDEILDPELRSDVLCLLGDIGDPTSSAYRDLLAAAAARFTTVLLLAGNNEYRNHEGGGRTMQQTEQAIRTAAAPYGNVRFLQNETHVVGHVAFIGTTLWSYLPDEPLPQQEGSGGGRAADGAAAVGADATAAGTRAEEHIKNAAWDTAAERASTARAAVPTIPVTGEAANAAGEVQDADVTVRTASRFMPLVASPSAGAVSVGKQNVDGTGGRRGLAPASARTHVSEFSVPHPAAVSTSRAGAAVSAAAGIPVVARTLRQGTAGMRSLAARSQPLPSALEVMHGRMGMGAECEVAGGSAEGACSSGGGVNPKTRCRLLTLRHSISLSSLQPEDPLPSWQVNADGSSGGGSGSGSDGSSGSSEDESGSDAEGRSDTDTESGVEEGSEGAASESITVGSIQLSDSPASPVSPGSGAKLVVSPSQAPQDPESLTLTTSALAAAFQGPSAVSSAAQQRSQPTAAPAATTTPSIREPPAAPTPAAVASSTAAPTSTSTSSPADLQAPASQPAQHHHSSHPRTHPRYHPYHHHHSRNPATAAAQTLLPPTTVREYVGATSLDYRRVFITPGGPPITTDFTNYLFAASLEYVRTAVAAARSRGLVPVVLTHHAPSMYGTCRPKFAGHPSTHAYGTDMSPYLAGSGVAVWYCGHTHYNFDMVQGGVRLASNQFGSQLRPAEGYNRYWQHILPPPSAVDLVCRPMGKEDAQEHALAPAEWRPSSVSLTAKGSMDFALV